MERPMVQLNKRRGSVSSREKQVMMTNKISTRYSEGNIYHLPYEFVVLRFELYKQHNTNNI